MRTIVGLLVLASGILFAAPSPVAAAIIYRETFGNDTGANASQATLSDWALHTGSTGSYNMGPQISNGPGKVGDVDNVNAGPTISQTNGYFYHASATETPPALFWTPEYSFDPADYEAGSIQFSWYQGNISASDAAQLAIRIGSQWYASTQTFTNAAVSAGGNFPLGDDNGNGGVAHGGELKTLTFSPTAASWALLNFSGTYNTATNAGTNSGAGLSLGSVLEADLPSGVIDAFGWYFNSPSTNIKRLDTMTIQATAIPEPSTLALAGFGLAMLGGWLSHRRRGMDR